MLRLFSCFFVVLLGICFPSYAQKSASFENTTESLKKPISFTHQPFLLLKVTPTSFFEADRNFRYGVEIAPPFGKFSFCFDYGKGKGEGIFRNNEGVPLQNMESTQYRGEIRMYFSDWFPFYALDKKPFGRYYAIEYVHKNINSSQTFDTGYQAYPFEVPSSIPFLESEPLEALTFERAINIKIGKHFHLTRFLFIDAFAGIGLGQSTTTPMLETFDAAADFQKQKFSIGQPNRELASKGLFLSKTAGLRLCLVL